VSFRFRNFTLAALLTGGALVSLHLTSNAQDTGSPIDKIFDDTRVLVGNAAIPAEQLTNTPIGETYCNIKPGRSIFFYDCVTYGCGKKDLPDLDFKTIFGLAAKSAPANSDVLFNGWYQAVKSNDAAMDGTIGNIEEIQKQNFQLLAIANRMDMAEYHKQDGVWTGAEIHFAYGPRVHSQFTLILEFELTDPNAPKPGIAADKFKKMAQSWSDLSLDSVSDADYPSKLKETLAKYGLPLSDNSENWISRVRIRTNHNLQGSLWHFTQMRLDPGAGKFAPEELNNQIRAKLSASDESKLWGAAEAALMSSKPFEVQGGKDGFIETHGMDYTPSVPSILGTPAKYCSSKTERTRNILAMQRCTGCHTVESRTQFNHIANRDSGENSKLSGFLIGEEGDLHPPLLDLYTAKKSKVWQSEIKYKAYTGAMCDTPTTDDDSPTVVRKFHDIARRTLFLAGVLNDAFINTTPASQKWSSHSIE